jgi:hypothetical protein
MHPTRRLVVVNRTIGESHRTRDPSRTLSLPQNSSRYDRQPRASTSSESPIGAHRPGGGSLADVASSTGESVGPVMDSLLERTTPAFDAHVEDRPF